MVRRDGQRGKTFHSRAGLVLTPPWKPIVACQRDHGPEELQIQQIQKYLLGIGKLVPLERPEVQSEAERGNPKS
jgi:hypothetical protein